MLFALNKMSCQWAQHYTISFNTSYVRVCMCVSVFVRWVNFFWWHHTTSMRLSIMPVHTEKQNQLHHNYSCHLEMWQFYFQCSLLLCVYWTTYWYLLHHSSSVCNIYITNQDISTSCTHKQLTCTPFSFSFWCF